VCTLKSAVACHSKECAKKLDKIGLKQLGTDTEQSSQLSTWDLMLFPAAPHLSAEVAGLTRAGGRARASTLIRSIPSSQPTRLNHPAAWKSWSNAAPITTHRNPLKDSDAAVSQRAPHIAQHNKPNECWAVCAHSRALD
jgi:hypothetical protein